MALSKTGRFLSKAEILGVGVFSPLPTEGKQDTGEIQKEMARRRQSVIMCREVLYEVLCDSFSDPFRSFLGAKKKAAEENKHILSAPKLLLN